ncbi:hypothetical protein ABPG77_008453 [Micractinium sp. CCAP 211/92]
MSGAGRSSRAGSVLQAVSAAVDLDPRRVLLRHLRQLEAERQAELAIFSQMLERLPTELVRRIVYMADALQRLDEFCHVPWSPDQLSQWLASVALMSRAHRDTAALTPCSVVLPVVPLLEHGRLDSCLAWLARRRLSDVRLASAGLQHGVAATLAAALALHAPALSLSSPLLVLVADQAGQVFNAGMLAAFRRQQAFQLHQYAAVWLAALPASVTSLTVYLPGRTHERQHPQHPPRPPYLLPAPEGPMRPLLSPPLHRLAQLTMKGCLSAAAGLGGTHVEVEAVHLFAAAAAVSLEVHTLCLRVPLRQPGQHRRWLAAVLGPAQALARWAKTAAGQQLRGWRRSSRATGVGRGCYQPLAFGDSSAGPLEEGTCKQGHSDGSLVAGSGGGSSTSSSRPQQPARQQQQCKELLAALLDCFESSGCTSAVLTATCVQLAPAEPAGAPEADGSQSLAASAASAGAERAASTAAAFPLADGSTSSSSELEGAGCEIAVPAGACSEQLPPPMLRFTELRRLLAAQPRRGGVLPVVLRDELLAEVGEGAAALGADGALLRLVLCRRSAARSVDSRPLVNDLPTLEARMRTPVRQGLLTCLGLVLIGWGLTYILFFAIGPAALLARAVLLCIALVLAGALHRRAREGRPVDVGSAMRTVGRRLRLALF